MEGHGPGQKEGGEIMKKAVIHFESRHESGNIFAIMAMVRKQMQKERRITEWNNAYERVMNSHSNQEAMAILGELVELVDDDKED